MLTTVVWWASIAIVGALALVLIAIAGHLVGGGALRLEFYFRLPGASYRVFAGPLGKSTATVTAASGELAFARPRIAFVLVAAAVLAVLAAAWLYVVYQLRGLASALAGGHPFERQNSARLMRIGLAVIGFELAHAVVVWLGTVYLEHHLVTRGLTIRPHFGVDLAVLLLGALLVALAAAFRAGHELAEDEALTI